MFFIFLRRNSINQSTKSTLKADKKKPVKNDISYNTCKQYIVQI